MVYQVPKSRASFKQNVFEFQLPGSQKVWSIPLARYVNADLLMRMQEITGRLKPIIEAGGEAAVADEDKVALNAIQRRIVEHYCPGIFEETTLDQIEDILMAWRDASNPNGQDVDLGESSPSA